MTRRSNVRPMPRVGRRVRSFVDAPPGAQLLGTVLGHPWTPPVAWLDDALEAHLPPEAVRFAWRVTGQRARVAIAAEFVSCGAQPCAICEGDCYTHGPFLFEYIRNEGGGVERAAIARLGRKSPPPTLADVSLTANEWRKRHEERRAAQRWHAAGVRPEAPDSGFDFDSVPPDFRGPRPDFRAPGGYDFRAPPPHGRGPAQQPIDFEGSEAAWRRAEQQRAYEEQQQRVQHDEQLAQLRGDMKLLGLERGFTREDLKKAHRRLVVELHPDRGGNDEQMAEVNAANDRLANLFDVASP
jgi:DnaJ domain